MSTSPPFTQSSLAKVAIASDNHLNSDHPASTVWLHKACHDIGSDPDTHLDAFCRMTFDALIQPSTQVRRGDPLRFCTLGCNEVGPADHIPMTTVQTFQADHRLNFTRTTAVSTDMSRPQSMSNARKSDNPITEMTGRRGASLLQK